MAGRGETGEAFGWGEPPPGLCGACGVMLILETNRCWVGGE